MPHWGLEPASVLRLAFQSDAVPTELFPPIRGTHTVTPLTHGTQMRVDPKIAKLCMQQV